MMATKGEKEKRVERQTRLIREAVAQANTKVCLLRYLDEGTFHLPGDQATWRSKLEVDLANLEFKLMTLLDDRWALQQEMAEEVSE